MPRHAVIVGAGLAGSLLAVSLARDGWRVSVYERRPDPRTRGLAGGRSINLAVSARGIAGLASVGLDREILAGHAIAMPGRMIHAREAGPAGHTVFQPYSKNPADAIHSFSRGGLNLALIEAAAREPTVELHFDHACLDVDFHAPAAIFTTPDGRRHTVAADLILAADGAYSAARMAFQRADLFEYSQSYLGHGYKELRIPPATSAPAPGFAIEPHALHIWPRGGAMMIALPNTDGSFTNTLFWPFAGDHSFESLEADFQRRRREDPSAQPTNRDRARVLDFFQDQYPDAVGIMPTLVDDFFANPTSSLVTVRCWPWRRGRVALLGDAAHAIVPFYGQGMNAAFEDVVLLASLLRTASDIESALDEFQSRRKPNADAIAEMALANFIEMRDKVGSPEFRYRKKVEQTVHEMFENRVSPQYNLVSFSTVPYVEARRRGAELDRVVDHVVAAVPTADELPDRQWRERVRNAAAIALAGNQPPAAGASPVSAAQPHTEAAGFIDISPVISPRINVWPGDTPFTREVLCDIKSGSNITLSTLRGTVHLGSHADGPNHYARDGVAIDRMPLNRYIGRCRVIEASVRRGARVRPADVPRLGDVREPIVLIKTGTFPDHESWNEDFAALSVELVEELARLGVLTVGVDTPSVDLQNSKDLEAHQAFYRGNMAIIEGLRLAHVTPGVYELIAPPLKLEGFDASPVRAVLRPLTPADAPSLAP
ncbi:MAG: Kynurenine 3-monooxygenase [Phycisphaerales bacterium]|nr:Kynurenine 3-monooxygenase [Phycisphaerales bacterium]